jgi:hypothetical protein
MINKFFLTMLIFSHFASCSQNKNTIYIDRGKEIVIAYGNLINSKDNLNQEQIYFNLFPENFKDFNSIFGYSNNSPYKIENEGFLYNDAFKYIDTFFQLDLIDKELFTNKIINISIGGKWYADGVNYFQHDMKIYLINNLDFFCKILSSRSENEIESFFVFYFDGIHLETMPKEFEEIKRTDSKLFKIIQKSYNLKSKNKK